MNKFQTRVARTKLKKVPQQRDDEPRTHEQILLDNELQVAMRDALRKAATEKALRRQAFFEAKAAGIDSSRYRVNHRVSHH